MLTLERELNYSTLQDVNDLAILALLYFVLGIASNFEFSLPYSPTKAGTAYQIMSTFQEAVAVLKLTCKLQVIVTVSDGAFSNHKFYWMHE